MISVRDRIPSLKIGDRYTVGVIEASEAIHGSVVGTGDPLSDGDLLKLSQWLEWRVGPGWMSGNESRYDYAVQSLGIAAVIEAIGRNGKQ